MSASQNERRAQDAFMEMLAHLHRKQDISALTETINRNFPNGHSMYRANSQLWSRVGLKNNDALLFSLMKDVARYASQSAYGDHPSLRNLAEASPYLATHFSDLNVEHFYMFCLNSRGKLKERILLNAGIADTALFDLRRLLLEAVRLRPLGGVIIAHNHPGGTLRPSQDDIDCTLDAIEALSALEAPLLDHVIVAHGKVVSLRQNGFVPEEQWLNQNPRHRILRDWLSPAENAAPIRKNGPSNR